MFVRKAQGLGREAWGISKYKRMDTFDGTRIISRMPKGNGDRNYVSIWWWLMAFLVMAIPCIGIVMIFVWAFTGDNETRKNFFKAHLILALIVLIAVALYFAVMILVFGGLAASSFHSGSHNTLPPGH